MTRLFFLSALVLGTLLAAESRGVHAAAQAEIARLFEIGWETTPAARTAADRHFQELAAKGQADGRTAYAYALVLMKQRRYDDALKQIDSVLRVEGDNLPARQSKIRLLMLTKKYSAALVELNQLGEALTAAPQERVPEERRAEMLRFIGRMFGFLEAPAAGDVSAAAWERVRRQVEKRFSEQELTIYDQARDAVLVRFAEMTGESERGREEALAEAERQRDEARQDLEQRREQQKDRRTELLERRDQLRKEVQDQEAAFAKAERPLLDRLAVLERQAAVPRRELALLTVDIDRLHALAAQAKDPIVRDQYLFRAQQLEIVAARYDSDLIVLERQASAVNAERAALRERYGRELASLARSVQSVDQELEGLQRGERRFAMDERRLDKPLNSGTRRVRAIEAEAAAFTTYEPLPLEEERQRVLEGK